MATPPNWLANRRRDPGGGTVQPQRYSGASAAGIGTAFGNAPTFTIRDVPKNQAIQFDGDLFAIDELGVYKKDDPAALAGAWTEEIAVTGPSTTGLATGIYPYVLSAGTAGLFYVFEHGSNAICFVRFDGTNWTQGATITTTTLVNMMGQAMFGNKLHVIAESNSGVVSHLVLDPVAETISVISNPWGATLLDSSDLVVFEDRLFALYGKTGDYILSEYTGTWNDRTTVTGFDAGSNNDNHYTAVVQDGAMFWMFPDFGASDNDRGWGCVEFNSALAFTDQTLARLHDDLIPVNKTGGHSVSSAVLDDERIMVSYDPVTTPGTVQPWVWHAANGAAGTSFALYEWPTVAGQMIFDSTGGDVRDSMPVGYQHGERIWTPGDLDIHITSTDFGVNIEKVFFRAAGDAGTADKTVNFRFTTQKGPPTTAEATLTGAVTVESGGPPAGVPTRVGNSIIGLDADKTVLYSCFWAAGTDSATSRAQLTPFIT